MNPGDIVLLRFPYSDLSGSKVRPAVVVTMVDRGDFVACQITSSAATRKEMIPLTPASFARGALNVASFVLPGKLFTAQGSIVTKIVARLTDTTRDQVKDAVVRVIRG